MSPTPLWRQPGTWAALVLLAAAIATLVLVYAASTSASVTGHAPDARAVCREHAAHVDDPIAVYSAQVRLVDSATPTVFEVTGYGTDITAQSDIYYTCEVTVYPGEKPQVTRWSAGASAGDSP